MQKHEIDLKEYEEEKRPFDEAMRELLQAKPKPPKKPKLDKKSS